MTLTQRIKFAKDMTMAVSQIKDWRLRRKSDRELKRIAQGWAADKGYMIATVREMTQRYPALFRGFEEDPTDKKYVWGILENGYKSLQRLGFAPF